MIDDTKGRGGGIYLSLFLLCSMVTRAPLVRGAVSEGRRPTPDLAFPSRFAAPPAAALALALVIRGAAPVPPLKTPASPPPPFSHPEVRWAKGEGG